VLHLFPSNRVEQRVDFRVQDPQNWSLGKKFFVSCEIWLLTFAVYIGSAIFTPGIPGVSEQFGVSSVAATLGLTLFVFGYGLGGCHSC
jgi:DHA1 family multidrug resistance protein-like MFS transporter